MKTKRILAWCLVLAMTMTFMPGITIGVSAEPTVVESSTKQNTNQAGGIIYTKTSTAKSDGTVDITLTAHTTGEVRQMTSVTPTDIVLVLDTSGSMADSYTTTTITGYNAVLGDEYTYTTGFWLWQEEHTAYGFGDSSLYFVNTGTSQEPNYTRVIKEGEDENGFEFYGYTLGTTEVFVYPELTADITPLREYSHDVVQFYRANTHSSTVNKMTELKSAVKEFIDTTAAMNTGLAQEDMHNISIVQFASNASVISELTAVDAAGATTLKSAVDGLYANGATAVDYGLEAAEEVLMNRSEVMVGDAVDRNEVIVVFADGEPNHQNGFDATVANDSIEIAGRMKKDAGVLIYTVCIAEGADANNETTNINKFMHYVSSNFPDATSMTSPGARTANSDYYKTIDNDNSLSLIFDSIIQEIDHPTISMGEEATLIDTLSPYFDFTGVADDVKLQTSLRNSDGTWAEPVDPGEEDHLTYEIVEDRLTVKGFDFDENFVSSKGRGENGDFYGKQLVISFKVKPDYSVIDAASATLMDGILPTNSGFASINDSDFTPAAEVETPELNTHQVIYKVDEQEIASYNRFVGSNVTVENVPSKPGHTFSGWSIDGEPYEPDDEFIMPDADVEIVGTFTVNEHKVKYQYSGTVPDGAPELPETSIKAYGSTVSIAQPAQFAGYIFNGWYPLQTDLSVSNGTFTMPDKDVTLVGYFEPSTNTPYKVEHYLETLTDGVYETTPVLVEEGFTGTTGHTVTATPLNRFTGFTYNETKSADTISGEILADGSLVLKVFYDRNEYKVTYGFEGDTEITGLPMPPAVGTYKFGQTVTVADKAVPPAGYSFTGWYRGITDNEVEGTFVMPDYDVHLLGFFTANPGTEYTIEHYLMDTNGDYETTPEVTERLTGKTGNDVEAKPLTIFEGFTYNAGASTATGEILGDGSLVLKLYYDRNKYEVTYEYERTIPDGASAIPMTVSYYHGETVDIEADATAEGYTFSGWHVHSEDITVNSGSFEMPKRNVNIYGYFTANTDTAYKVEHYVEKLDGSGYEETPYTTQNLTGTTGAEVTATSVAITGFAYNDAESTATKTGTIKADGSLVLKLYYDRNEYKVKYEYEGDIPDGVPTLPTEETYAFGEEVEVKPQATAPVGYTFVGWYRGEVTNILTSFTMPDREVVLRGYFAPGDNTPFTVHHYLETLTDGVYEITPEVAEDFTGRTGNTVTATPLNRFSGFIYNETKSASTISGEILGDGSLVLKVYYDRIPYNVTYGYEGDIPASAPTLPTGGTYLYGADVTVASPVTAPAGYTFVGWYRGTTDNEVEGTFEMPMFDVNILGHFVKNTNTPYNVEHYLQNIEGTGYELDSSETRHGTTGDTVSALIRDYHGFVYDDDNELNVTSGEIAGDGSLTLKFYYNRNIHNVKYEYEGITPVGTPALPDEVTNVRFGAEITVAAVPSVPGYTFTGWYEGADTNVVTSFTMPDKDVVLKGKFASNLVDYQVNYWFQNLDAGDIFDTDEYTLDTANSYTRQAYVGEHVEAENKVHTGFSVNEHSNRFGHVTVDEYGTGNLVLNVYYDRHTYNVTYSYYGEQPAGVPDLTGKNMTNVRFGKEVNIDSKPALSGYVFDGWYTNTATVNNGKFTMPDHHVNFYGRFIKEYTVSYDLNGGTGATGVDYSNEIVTAGTVVTAKDAPTRNNYTFEGWESVLGVNEAGDSITVNQDITFVAKWRRNGGGGGGTTTYVLTYESNGGTEYKKETYNYNTIVDIVKKPEKEGYIFEGWYEDKELTKYVEEVKMTRNITVYAKWVEDNGSAGNGHDTPESLNSKDHFAYVVGYPDGTVKPENNISRAEVTTIFFRLLIDEVRDNNLTTVNNFADIDSEDWYNTAISTMAKLGIVKGRSRAGFAPDAFITRAEFAAICARFDNSEYEVADKFTDISGHWAENEIHEAAAHGWIRGYEDGTFRPDRFITRAEAMTMINRVLNRVPNSADDLHSDMVIWPDNSDESIWYYLAVQEATNSHDYEMINHIYEKWTDIRETEDWKKYE